MTSRLQFHNKNSVSTHHQQIYDNSILSHIVQRANRRRQKKIYIFSNKTITYQAEKHIILTVNQRWYTNGKKGSTIFHIYTIKIHKTIIHMASRNCRRY